MRVSSCVIWAIGAIARPARMVQAMMAPNPRCPSRTKNAPTAITPTCTNCCAMLAMLLASWASRRDLSPTCDWCATASCQRRRINAPAPSDLMVSRPLSVSTRMACLWWPSSCDCFTSCFSLGCTARPDSSITGTAISGTQASGPPMSQIITRNKIAKGTSMKVVSVADVRKSRIDSNSFSVLATEPVLPRRACMRASRICSNSESAIALSARALARSKK